MASHYEIRPDERGLALRVASRALRVASGLATARPGNVFIPNKDEDGFSDGTGTWIGSGAVGNGGVAPWVGDTTPPGRPAGVSATSAWGTVYAKWDGTLEGGVPADFAYVEVAIDGSVVGRLTEAGAVAADGYEDGHEATVTFVAYDAARLMDGTLSPNASEAATVTLTVVDERDAIDADVEEARRQAQAAADSADAAADKADSLRQQIEGVTTTVDGVERDVAELSTQVSGAVEDASRALTAASSARQDLDGFKATVSQTYETKADADAAMAQEVLDRNSAIEQSASEITQSVSETYQVKGDYATGDELDDAIAQEVLDRNSAIEQSATQITQTVSQTYTTKAEASAIEGKADAAQAAASSASSAAGAAQSAADAAQDDLDGFKGTVSTTYATKSSLDQTADSIRSEVSETYVTKTDADGDYQPKGDYLTDSEAGATYATKAALTQTSDSILSEVEKTYQSKDGMSSYYTKSEVDQRDGAITSTVSEVQTTADSAMEKATTVEQTASGLEVRLTQAEKDVDAAQTTANTANSTANTAKTNAAAAQTAANNAQSTANTANSTASSALNRATYQYGTCSTAAATAAKVVALSGFSLFTGATIQVKFTYANTASNPTLNVNSTGAKTIRAYGANLTSSSAYNWVANSIVTLTYDGTYWNIADASSLSKASSALTTANTASTAASNAQSTANAAQTTANAAQSAAEDAAKTATNYLGFSSGGLVVGTNSSGTGQSGLQGNARLYNGGMEVRNGTTVLSRYGASMIELGINSTSATTTMCGGVASISVTKSGSNATMLIETLPASSSGGYGSIVLRPRHVGTSVTQIEVTGDGAITLSTPNRINLNAVGDVWNESAPICQGVQAVFGMKVVKTLGDSTCNIESFSSLTSKVGFTVGRYNCVLHATTSDFAAYHQRLDSYASVDSIGIIGSGPNVNIRVNYVIFCWPG